MTIDYFTIMPNSQRTWHFRHRNGEWKSTCLSGILGSAFSSVLHGIKHFRLKTFLLDSHGASQVPNSSSVKVTLKVLTDNLQIVMCGKFVCKALNHFLLMTCSLCPHTLYITADVVKVKPSPGFSVPWEEC